MGLYGGAQFWTPDADKFMRRTIASVKALARQALGDRNKMIFVKTIFLPQDGSQNLEA